MLVQCDLTVEMVRSLVRVISRIDYRVIAIVTRICTIVLNHTEPSDGVEALFVFFFFGFCVFIRFSVISNVGILRRVGNHHTSSAAITIIQYDLILMITSRLPKTGNRTNTHAIPDTVRRTGAVDCLTRNQCVAIQVIRTQCILRRIRHLQRHCVFLDISPIIRKRMGDHHCASTHTRYRSFIRLVSARITARHSSNICIAGRPLVAVIIDTLVTLQRRCTTDVNHFLVIG